MTGLANLWNSSGPGPTSRSSRRQNGTCLWPTLSFRKRSSHFPVFSLPVLPSSIRRVHRLHPEDGPRVFEKMTPLVEQGGGAIEYRFRHRDGHYVWIQDT